MEGCGWGYDMVWGGVWGTGQKSTFFVNHRDPLFEAGELGIAPGRFFFVCGVWGLGEGWVECFEGLASFLLRGIGEGKGWWCGVVVFYSTSWREHEEGESEKLCSWMRGF